MDTKHYSYSQQFLFKRMPVIMMYVIIGLFLPIAVLSIFDIVSGQYAFDIEGIGNLLFYVLSPLILTILFSIDLNMLPSISIDKKGIKVQYFNFRWLWIQISWNEIVNIEPSTKTYRGHNIWCIKTRLELTRWHRLLSKKYCGDYSPNNILFTALLENSEELVRDIHAYLVLSENVKKSSK